jgi:hypothetical protein
MALHAEILDVRSMSWRVPTSGVRLLHAYCLPSVSLCCSSIHEPFQYMDGQDSGWNTRGIALGKESFKASCMGPCSTCCSWQFGERDMQTEGETLLLHTTVQEPIIQWPVLLALQTMGCNVARQLSSRIDGKRRRRQLTKQPPSSRPARPHDTGLV